MKLYYHTKQ